MDFRLAQPEALWGLIPLSLFIAYLLWKRIYRSQWFSWRRFWLSSLGFLICILALSRPQGGSLLGEPEPLAPSVLVALDISNSMLAEDITPSRLSFSISFINKLLESLANPRVALFPFAASGFLLMPFTTDIYAIKESLESIDPSATSNQGTDFNSTLEGLSLLIKKLESNAKEQLEGWQPPKIILFSDGESHYSLNDEVLKPFQQSKTTIFTVGVGTPEGTAISINGQNNKTVITKLDPTSLQKIALKTGGAYFSSSYENIPLMINQLNQTLTLGKRSKQFKVTSEFFPILFALSLILFLGEFCFGRWHYVIRNVAFFLLLACGSTVMAEDDQTKAIQTFNKAVEESKSNQLEKAAEHFEESSLILQDPEQKKSALYNLGNVFLKMGDPEQALESYQKAFQIQSANPNFESNANRNISDNMALASKVLEEMKKQSQPNGSEDPDKGDKQPGSDPQGPKKFRGESLTDQQKQKLYDLIAGEEKQTLKRLREQNRPPQPLESKPW